MPATVRRPLELATHRTQITVRDAADGDLRPGTCGTIMGVACVYNTPDYYGTMFAPGCFAKTAAQKISAGKVKLFTDHEWETRSHIGVVRSFTDAGMSVIMEADLLDTEDGRAAKEYLAACMAAKAFTGLSVGVFEREGALATGPDGSPVWAFTECELEEVSTTPVPAVPGSEVLTVRSRPPDTQRLLRVALGGIIAALGPDVVAEQLRILAESRATTEAHRSTATAEARNAAGHTPPDSDRIGEPRQGISERQGTALASLDDRLAAVRASFAIT